MVFICNEKEISPKGRERMKAKEEIQSIIIEDKQTSLQEVLDSIETHAEITFCGQDIDGNKDILVISWSEKGRGFGEYTFIRDRRNSEVTLDSEDDSKETVKRMLGVLVDSVPLVN